MTRLYLHGMSISPATHHDIPSLTVLINSAYRGEGSKKGWTTEADLLTGSQRTDEASLATLLDDTNASILKYVTGDGAITGCVYVRQQDGGLYLGMLTVSPTAQGMGIGKQLLLTAEQYAAKQKCNFIFMNVISVRAELIDWYTRHGYIDTGNRAAFPEDHRFGVPTQKLEFAILKKDITRP
jgi:ribosomal protein S18 acetylase RimI-like enzyme